MALPAQAPGACVLRDQGSLRVLEAAPPSPRQDQLGGFTLTDRPLTREQLREAGRTVRHLQRVGRVDRVRRGCRRLSGRGQQ